MKLCLQCLAEEGTAVAASTAASPLCQKVLLACTQTTRNIITTSCNKTMHQFLHFATLAETLLKCLTSIHATREQMINSREAFCLLIVLGSRLHKLIHEYTMPVPGAHRGHPLSPVAIRVRLAQITASDGNCSASLRYIIEMIKAHVSVL